MPTSPGSLAAGLPLLLGWCGNPAVRSARV
jgi:hypothetical protein